MVGHYLLVLTPEQEDRVLTNPMRAGPYITADGCRCFVGVVGDASTRLIHNAESASRFQFTYDRYQRGVLVGVRYDQLCERFGEPRVNAAIRDRILTNRLWRARSASEAFAYLDAQETAV